MTGIKLAERTKSTRVAYDVSAKPSQTSYFERNTKASDPVEPGYSYESAESFINQNSDNSVEKFCSDLDPLPEDVDYSDDGCKWFYACLKCPFPDCVYGSDKLDKNQIVLIRDAAMVNLYQTHQALFEQLPDLFRISVKSVYRVIGHHQFSHHSPASVV